MSPTCLEPPSRRCFRRCFASFASRPGSESVQPSTALNWKLTTPPFARLEGWAWLRWKGPGWSAFGLRRIRKGTVLQKREEGSFSRPWAYPGFEIRGRAVNLTLTRKKPKSNEKLVARAGFPSRTGQDTNRSNHVDFQRRVQTHTPPSVPILPVSTPAPKLLPKTR